MAMLRPRIGAHVKTSGGVGNAVRNALEIGAECLQIFGASPRQWRADLPSQEEIDGFWSGVQEHGLGPVYLHAAYLANLSSGKEDVRETSVESLAAHLRIAEALGGRGLIFHVGSADGMGREAAMDAVEDGVKRVLERAPGSSLLILENAASSKKLGSRPEEVAELLDRIGSDRLAVCLDTAHACGAGNLDKDRVAEWCAAWDRSVGLSLVPVLHANDSKAPCGSERDLHENIGEGHLGREGFSNLAADPRLRDKDWILEVPGLAGEGPDKENVDRLKKLFS